MKSASWFVQKTLIRFQMNHNGHLIGITSEWNVLAKWINSKHSPSLFPLWQLQSILFFKVNFNLKHTNWLISSNPTGRTSHQKAKWISNQIPHPPRVQMEWNGALGNCWILWLDASMCIDSVPMRREGEKNTKCKVTEMLNISSFCLLRKFGRKVILWENAFVTFGWYFALNPVKREFSQFR